MKVQIKQLKPNPYRDMANYPIDEGKVESLVCSMEQTGFWDNILARPKPGFTKWQKRADDGEELDEMNEPRYLGVKKNGELTEPIFEIAYGHHRLEALKQVKKPNDWIDIPVKKLDDATMIQIMANENMEHWSSNITVINETVLVAKKFLDAELAKYKTFEDLQKASFIFKRLLDKFNFNKIKRDGVGASIVTKFLGENWSQSTVSSALNTLEEKQAKREAVEILGSTYKGEKFKDALKSINEERKKEGGKPIPKEDTPRIAKAIKERIANKKIPGGDQTWKKAMKVMVRQEVDQTDEYDATLKDIQVDIETITSEAEKLNTRIMSFNGRLHEMEIKNLKSMKSLFAMGTFSELLIAIKTMTEYFGYEFNDLKEE